MSDLKSIPEAVEEELEYDKDEDEEELYVEDEELNRDVDLRKEVDGLESEDDPVEYLKFESAEGKGRDLVSRKDSSLGSKKEFLDTQENLSEKDNTKNDDVQIRTNADNNDKNASFAELTNGAGLTSGDVISDVIMEANTAGTFDNYLMDKLLHSEAEPPLAELTEPDGYEKPPSVIQGEITQDEAEIDERLGASPLPTPLTAPTTEPASIAACRSPTEQAKIDMMENLGIGTAPEDHTLPGKQTQKGVTFEESPETGPGKAGVLDSRLTGIDGAPAGDTVGSDRVDDVEDRKVVREEEQHTADTRTEDKPARTGDEEDEELLRKIDEEYLTRDDEDTEEEGEEEGDTPEPELTIPESSEEDEEEDEEEEYSGEMTKREKKAVVKAVRRGDIDLVELLLEKRNADMNMLWFNENLVMVAIRARQTKMAEFLIDNGWDYNHTTYIMDATDGYHGPIKCYEMNCRQMAFELGLDDVVELIDLKNNNLFPGVRPKQREIRTRRPRPPTPPTPSEDADDEMSCSGADDICKEGLGEVEEAGEEGRQRRRKKTDRDIDSGVQSFRTTDIEEGTAKEAEEQESEHSVKDVGEHCDSEDGSSHVFGMDEGYETMSPFSPFMHDRLDQSLSSPREQVAVRGTKASTAIKMHTYRVRGVPMSERMRTQPVQYPPVLATGSYVVESKQWHQPAPPPSSLKSNIGSVESIPQAVRTGTPWVHGVKSSVMDNKSKPSKNQTKPVTSTRSALSPYSQVAKLLSESRLLNQTSSSASSSKFPSISGSRVYRNSSNPIRTETNYIYANRSKTIAEDFTKFRYPTNLGATELRKKLMPRRKLKSN